VIKILVSLSPPSGPSSSLPESAAGDDEGDDYDDMDVEDSDQGYRSQTPLQPLIEQQDIEAHQQPIQPCVTVVRSLSQQDDHQPTAMTTQEPNLDVSLVSDAIAGNQSTSPSELPETLDSGLGSEPFTVMSESNSQSPPAINLPVQPVYNDTAASYTSSSVPLLEEPPAISVSTTIPSSSELSAPVQPEPAVLTVPLPTSTASSGYSAPTVLDSGSIPDQHTVSHSQTVVSNLPPTPLTAQPVEETTGRQSLLESSAIPALIPENMSLEQLHEKVKEYFPSFKPYGILRFLSLLGPGNPSSLPNVWKGAKKPKRRRKEGEWKGGITATWELDKEFTPPPEMCMSDDEVSQYVIGCAVFVI